jgi:signal transduction histidine kinase/CheY-like chemotaxis protein
MSAEMFWLHVFVCFLGIQKIFPGLCYLWFDFDFFWTSITESQIARMRTILVLSPHPVFAETIQAGLDAAAVRIIHRVNAAECEPLLVHGLVSVCLLDADLLGVESIWVIETLRRFNAKIPLVAFSENSSPEWGEEAFLRGVAQILPKPVRARLLNSVLERVEMPSAAVPAAGNPAFFPNPASPAAGGARLANNFSQALEVVRTFSPILTHSLNADAMLQRFLQFVREMLSVNRAVIFLNRPEAALAELPAPELGRSLRAVASVGLTGGLLEHFTLTLGAGLGAQVSKLGRIVRRDSPEILANPAAQKEFEMLGVQVAMPITSRDTFVGVAVFDARLTGEPLQNSELELLFHLLEQVGLALGNISLHDQITGNHELLSGVLRELSSACVVVGRDLKILHANKSARRHFGRKNERTGGFDFTDLPQMLGGKIYQVLKTGAALEPFRYEPENSPGTVYSVSIAPFRHDQSATPSSVLLTADDLSQAEQLGRLQVETANLRLVRNMADRLAHEIGNAMVPISTHQQLLAEQYSDKEFRKSLDEALGDGVKRVSRLVSQMRFLARDGQVKTESFPAEKLLEEAYQEAVRQQPVKGATLKIDSPSKANTLTGDRAALKHALAEIMLNALQANPKTPFIGVKLQTNLDTRAVTIEVADTGAGFSAETAKKVPAPFYTTRNVGLGLGLSVSQKIIETHHGRLEIVPAPSGLVRVSLPNEKVAAFGA